MSAAATASGIAIPPLLTALDDYRTAGAVRYVSTRIQRTRMEAVTRSTNAAMQFLQHGAGFRPGSMSTVTEMESERRTSTTGSTCASAPSSACRTITPAWTLACCRGCRRWIPAVRRRVSTQSSLEAAASCRIPQSGPHRRAACIFAGATRPNTSFASWGTRGEPAFSNSIRTPAGGRPYDKRLLRSSHLSPHRRRRTRDHFRACAAWPLRDRHRYLGGWRVDRRLTAASSRVCRGSAAQHGTSPHDASRARAPVRRHPPAPRVGVLPRGHCLRSPVAMFSRKRMERVFGSHEQRGPAPSERVELTRDVV